MWKSLVYAFQHLKRERTDSEINAVVSHVKSLSSAS